MLHTPSASDGTLVDDESSPLLEAHRKHDDPEAPKTAHSTPDHGSSIPRAKLVAVATMRLVGPIAFTHIYPYVNDMIRAFPEVRDKSKVGLYSGLVESIFALVELCCVYQWSKLSDFVGRKPVILTGALGIAITSLAFGGSHSLIGVLLARGLGGIFSGALGALTSVVGDITTPSNQAVIIPLFGLFWPLGAIIGPLLGGALATPAERFPRVFDAPFWHANPYFLPGCIVAAFGAFAFGVTFIFLPETLPTRHSQSLSRKTRDNSYGSTTSDTPTDSVPPDTTTDANVDSNDADATSLRQLLSDPILARLTASSFALSFLQNGFDVLFVLYASTPIAFGGLALTAAQIGTTLAAASATTFAAQLLVMPHLLRRVHPGRLYNVCMVLWIPSYLFLPALHPLARAAAPSNDERRVFMALMWAGIAGALVASRLANLAYSISLILFKRAAPPGQLGRVNGLAMFVTSLARAIAPAFVSSLFAWTAGRGIAGSEMWAGSMLMLAGAGAVVGSRLMVVWRVRFMD